MAIIQIPQSSILNLQYHKEAIYRNMLMYNRKHKIINFQITSFAFFENFLFTLYELRFLILTQDVLFTVIHYLIYAASGGRII